MSWACVPPSLRADGSLLLVGLCLHCRWSLGGVEGGSCRDSGVGNNYEQQLGSRCSTLAPGPSSVTATALWQLYQQFTTWPAGSLFLCGYKWLSSNPGPISLSTFGVWLQFFNLQLMRLLWGGILNTYWSNIAGRKVSFHILSKGN